MILVALTVILAIAIVAVVVAGLSVGVLLGQRPRLKEPCHGRSGDGGACASCTCEREE